VGAAHQFARAAGPDTTSVRVDTTASRPVTFDDVRGGEEFMNVGLIPCSIGFSVVGGFVTAGHCLDVGHRVLSPDFNFMGTVKGWTYPGKDYGWVDVFPGFTPRPLYKYGGSYLSVGSADVAAIGSSVCRSGITTGFRCGTIKARNVTVNTTSGQVSGLTRTNACANHGDSGGPFLSGGRAQGVLTHGPVDTSDPQGCYADTFFQPLRPILTNYRLNLLVASGQLPTITGMFCNYHGNNDFGCSMNYVVPGAAPQITWKVGGVTRSSWNNMKTVSGSCTATATTISVTATNYAGSWTENRMVLCLGGGLPHVNS
jgi:streptogrisin C